MPSPITVHVTHDEPLLAAGVVATLGQHPEFIIVPSPVTDESIRPVQVIVSSYNKALVLRAQTLQQFGQQASAILIIGPRTHVPQLRAAIEQGIRGYILQTCPLEELLHSVRTLAQGHFYITPAVVPEIAHNAAQARLTARENDILQLLCKGHSNSALSVALDISLNTVKVHVKSLMRKLDATTRTQAVVTAIEQGLIDRH